MKMSWDSDLHYNQNYPWTVSDFQNVSKTDFQNDLFHISDILFGDLRAEYGLHKIKFTARLILGYFYLNLAVEVRNYVSNRSLGDVSTNQWLIL